MVMNMITKMMMIRKMMIRKIMIRKMMKQQTVYLMVVGEVAVEASHVSASYRDQTSAHHAHHLLLTLQHPVVD